MRFVLLTQGLQGEKQLSEDNVAHIGGNSMGASPKTTNFLKECMADALLQLMKENHLTDEQIVEDVLALIK